MAYNLKITDETGSCYIPVSTKNIKKTEQIEFFDNKPYEIALYENDIPTKYDVILINGEQLDVNKINTFEGYYGWIRITVKKADGFELSSGHIYVIPKKEEIKQQINNMIRYIINRSKKIEFPGSVCDLFGINFYGNNRNFKAEDILNSILKVYAENYRHFYNNSRARLTEIKSVDSIEKLTTFSQDTARFIVTHPQYLSMAKDGPVKFKSNTYIPRKTLVSSNRKSYDIYENRIVLGFLKYLSNLSTQGEKFKDAMYIKRMISDPNTETETPEFGDVTELTGKFHKMYEKYKKIFSNTADITVDSLPQMTHIFKNVPHYRDIYKYIRLFFAGGTINIPDDDKIRWNLVTSSQIYEYYVFLKLDEELENDGYVRKEKNPRKNAAFPKYFYYEKGDEKKYLFYQPEIVYSGKPSDINLRRNTKISLGSNTKSEESYTPDYIIKSVDGSGNETYEIADAKFSDFDTVKEYYLPAAAFKYLLSVQGIDNAVIEGMQLYYCKGHEKNDRHPTLEKPYAKIKYLY